MKSVSVAVIAALGIHSAALAQDQGVQTAVDELNSQYEALFNQHNAAELAKLYAEDAVVLPPNADRLEGRSAIQDFIAAQFEQLGPSGFEISAGDALQLGAAVLGSGSYSMTAQGPNGEMPLRGDYMALLQQGDDGRWTISRQIWNDDDAQSP